MIDTDVLCEIRSNVMEITLNRPDVRNALVPHMFDSIARALVLAEESELVELVILKGTGISFCSGGDANYKPDSLEKVWEQLTGLVCGFESFRKPVIAKVHGHAIGIGCTLALLADFVIATNNSRFQFPFIKMGLVPEGTKLVTRRVPLVTARSLLLLGQPIDGVQAQTVGLIHKSVPDDDLDGEVEILARELIGLPAQAYGLVKEALTISASRSIEEMMVWEGGTQRSIRNSADYAQFRSDFFGRAGVTVK